jgi:hypothetical protein
MVAVRRATVGVRRDPAEARQRIAQVAEAVVVNGRMETPLRRSSTNRAEATTNAACRSAVSALRVARGGRWSPAITPGEQGYSDPVAPQIHRQHGIGLVLGLQPRLVVWALLENDDGSDDVIGLAVGGKGDRALIPPDPGTFESYSQSG